jgi:hypothetical protein
MAFAAKPYGMRPLVAGEGKDLLMHERAFDDFDPGMGALLAGWCLRASSGIPFHGRLPGRDADRGWPATWSGCAFSFE